MKPCDGLCGFSNPHTHDLTTLGKWNYIWRFKFQAALIPDARPYPPVSAEEGAPWFMEYEKAWHVAYPNYGFQSSFVRDEAGLFIWVTNTPQWDRDWFDSHGWKFPYAWITGPSRTFYRVGDDGLSTVVSLPDKGLHVEEDGSK